MAQGILWQLATGFDPLGQFSRGMDQAQKRQTLLEQLAGQREDRAFARDRDARDFQFRTQESERNQNNWQQQFAQNAQNQNAMRALQQQQFELQKQTANTAQIVMVEQPDGSKIPVRIDRQGNAMPVNVGIQQAPQNPDMIPPSGVDAKTWRVEQTKNIVKNVDNAPNAIRKANEMIQSVDGILNDPALNYSTGMFSPLQKIPATPQFRFGTRAAQLQGQAFLQAFESLKGGGQITEIEGQKATEAMGRLNTAQSAQDYRQALMELRGILAGAVERQQSLMNRFGPRQQTPAIPQPGEIRDGYRFRGGNPADPNSWERAQ